MIHHRTTGPWSVVAATFACLACAGGDEGGGGGFASGGLGGQAGGVDELMTGGVPDPGAGGGVAGNGGSAGTGDNTGGTIPPVDPPDGSTGGSSSDASTNGDGAGDAGGSADTGGGSRPLHDPGRGPWEPVAPEDVREVCGLDPALLAQANATLNAPWAVVRHGRLCHEFYPPGETAATTAEVYSTTKSLGALVVGMVSYQTRNIPRTGRKTGQLSDWDRVDHWLDSFSYNAAAHVAHVLAMVAHNPNLSLGNKQHAYDTVGNVQINSLSDMVNAAVAQDPARLGANIEEFTKRYLYEPLGMTASTWSGGAANKVFAYTWSSNVREMARVGLLILNGGFWNGERLLDETWTYKMTHPAFEDGNTAYGYLTWLGSRSNHSIGFSPPVTQGPSIPCAPAALWNTYPHGELSMSPDCNYEAPYDCEQEWDVGAWQAVGLGGQLIQGHPGLDLVVVARNDALGGAGVWPALLPALVAADPMFTGDQDAFCDAYGANRYAPDR
jgi:hypothetical protein